MLVLLTLNFKKDKVSNLYGLIVCIGVAEISLNKWEEENSPFQLPDDFKAFLQISDGLQLNWKIKKSEQIFNLGQMHLNKLRDIKKITNEKFKVSAIGYDDSDYEGYSSSASEEEPKHHAMGEER
jgi:hypothetical protein